MVIIEIKNIPNPTRHTGTEVSAYANEIKVWGVFEEIYSEKLWLSYQNGETELEFEDPYLGVKFINELIDPNYHFISLNDYGDEDETFYYNDEDE